jgi:preprotein translocase subunit SecG
MTLKKLPFQNLSQNFSFFTSESSHHSFNDLFRCPSTFFLSVDDLSFCHNIRPFLHVKMMHNIRGYYHFMMEQSLAIRVSLWTAAITFLLSIAFTIICLSFDCTYSVFYKPCSYLLPDNPYSCETASQFLCCGVTGNISCGEYSQCLVKPDESISTCVGLLITSWILYFVFIVSSVAFILLHRKLGPQIADDYTRMSQDIEINNPAPQPSENPPSLGIDNAIL